MPQATLVPRAQSPTMAKRTAPDREGAISGLVEQVQAASAAVSKKASATLDELSERGAKVAPRLKDEFQKGRERGEGDRLGTSAFDRNRRWSHRLWNRVNRL